MAKKRKIKKAKRAKVKFSRRAAVKDNSMTSAHVLGLSGGFIVLIAGILAILGINVWEGLQAIPNVIGTTVISMSVGIVCGLAILIATATAKKNQRLSGVFMLVFSLIALATPPMYGLIFGPVLSLIGSVLLLMKK